MTPANPPLHIAVYVVYVRRVALVVRLSICRPNKKRAWANPKRIETVIKTKLKEIFLGFVQSQPHLKIFAA